MTMPADAPNRGQPLRVLFVDTVPRLSGGEQSLADLVEGLPEVGVEPIVCLPGDGPLSDRLRASGALVRTVRIDEALLTVSRTSLASRPWIALRKFGSFLAASWRIRRLIRETQPRVVHSNTMKAHLLCVLPCFVTRTPLIWHVRDILPRTWLVRAFVACSRFASVIIVPSRAVAEPFRASRRGFRKIRLVPNGVRVAEFVAARTDRSLREDIGASPKDPVIGIVGRIAPWKGQEVFVRAAAMLSNRHPRARFAIIGSVLFPENDAPFDAYLHRLVLDLGIADQVAFLGYQPAPEAMAALDVVAHCSLEPEPFGRVIVEAMAAGKPIIAAAGGATQEILPPAAGFIVPPGRPELLADALDRIITDPELREHMSAAGADVAASFFGIERVVGSVAQIHRALAARTARRRRRSRLGPMVHAFVAKIPRPKVPQRKAPRHRVDPGPTAAYGWHRDASGTWVAPTSAPDPFAARDSEAVAALAEDIDEAFEEEFEDDEEYEAEDDGPERTPGVAFPMSPMPLARPPAERQPVAYPPQSPRASAPQPAAFPPRAPHASAVPPPPPRAPEVGVSILDLPTGTPIAPRVHRPKLRRRSVPFSVSGAQASVVAPIAHIYAGGYPIAPASDSMSGLPFPLAKPHPGYAAVKRFLDVVVAFTILVLGSPVWLAIAVAIKLETRGPVFHRGVVHGRDGVPFTYYKFRSMRVGMSDTVHRRFIERYVRENGGHVDEGELVYKLTSDARVTGVGRFARRFSIDEIPQLLNVLRGQMSLVGPRPPLDYEYALYDDAMKQRLAVPPGITGLQQVWARNMASFEDKLRMDLNYIRERSTWMDIKLLLWTIPVSFRGH